MRSALDTETPGERSDPNVRLLFAKSGGQPLALGHGFDAVEERASEVAASRAG